MQGTAEEQFAGIAAAARAEALNDIDNLLTDDDSVDYRQNSNLWNLKYRYRIPFNKFQTLMKQTIAHLKAQQTALWTLLALK